MLVEFSVENFRSIKTLQTLSFVASPTVSKNKEIDSSNIIVVNTKLRLLKSLAIYGANASGKSNIIKAIGGMLHVIDKSMSDDKVLEKYVQPFVLDSSSKNKPSFFQIVIVADKKMYRYGFQILNNEIIGEWLFGPALKKQVQYFTREKDNFTINKAYFKEGVGLGKAKTKSTTLFLSVVAALNGKIANKIIDNIKYKIGISLGITDSFFRKVTMDYFDDEGFKDSLLDFLSMADMGMLDIQKMKIDTTSEESEEEDDYMLISEREVKGRKKGTTKNYFDTFESAGTQKLLSLAGPTIASIQQGKVLIIDELDARLHPLLSKKLISLFNSEKNKSAQLLYVTHDTNLLDSSLVRRDQIYFVEKKNDGGSELYSLADIKGVRNDSVYEKDYIKGKYGAIPFLGDYKRL